MRATITLFILVAVLVFNANAQEKSGKTLVKSLSFKDKNLAQSEPKNYATVFNYGFDRSYMVITNEHAKETAIKLTPAYINYPYEARKIQLYGPTLRFTITANGYFENFPFKGIWVNAGNPLMDSIYKKSTDVKSGQHKPLSMSEINSLQNTITNTEKRFDISFLQVRIKKNGQVIQDWKNISQLETQSTTRNITSASFVVYNDQVNIHDQVTITFRNKKDTSLIRFEFERMDSPLLPFLASFGRDTTSTSLADYVKNTLETKIIDKETINEFYRYWPDPKIDLLGIRFKYDRIFSNTKLSFTFRKPDPDYVDTTLQYLLAAGQIKDSVWKTTGHILFLSDFKPGAAYTLLVRYKSTPGNIKTYTFYTLPEWYQTTKYKYIIGAAISLAVFALVLLLNRIRLKKEKNKTAHLQLGLKSIRSQLNPHFIFNALSSIQGLINKNDITGANHYLTEFSSLLRESLKNNDRELVPLNTELRILETYLKLEQLRFQFQYEIIVDETIDQNAIEIPALLLQPLIENAIKHGVAILNEKGKVQIDFRSNHQDFLISVSDNGKGFSQHSNTQGLGLKLTKDRILLLNQTFKKQPIELSIESAQNTGTTVHLSFKNWF
ncbi:MAG: histidine kinase [Sediminibacterium sp.]